MISRRFSDSVGDYTKLTYDTKSRRHFGKCPFCHSETDGFCVNDEKEYFYCYLCGEKGDRGSFFAKLFQTSRFIEAPTDKVQTEILEDAAVFYYRNLQKKDNPGYDYLVGRGLTEESMSAFGLGYARDEFNSLYELLKDKYPEDALMSSGLFVRTQKGHLMDLFRNRVMFPVIGKFDNVIAFGGRKLREEDFGGKYLNSPETAVFKKRQTLYSYPYALDKRASQIIVCEGYMDVIAMQSAGIPDSCAVLGVALTADHLSVIGRDYKRVVLCLDSDAAGINAAKRSIELLTKHGFDVRIPILTPAKDPDEFIRSFGRAAFIERITNALDVDSFLCRYGTLSDLVDVLMKQV